MFRHVWIAMFAALVAVSWARAQTPCEGWTPIGGPQARTNNAMAYDSRRGVVVMFGGSGGGFSLTAAPLSDTWEHDGRRWRFRSVDGPSPRYGCTMAYDARRGVTVLFGGLGGTLGMGEIEVGVVWEWDGTTWTRREFPGGPRGDEYVRSAYDAVRGVVLVWPARDAAGMYAYDGTGWTLIPRQDVWPTRDSSNWVYDSRRGVMIAAASCCGDVFEWNGEQWRVVSPQPGGEATFVNPTLAYDPMRERVVAISVLSDQTAEWNGSGWTTIAQSPGQFLNRYGAVAYHVQWRRLLGFGGFATSSGVQIPNDDLLVREGVAWYRIPAVPRPPVTSRAAMAFDVDRGSALLYGGSVYVSGVNQQSTSTWILRGESWRRASMVGPLTTSNALLAYSTSERAMIYSPNVNSFEGRTTWIWSGEAWRLASSTAPLAGNLGAAAFDPVRGVVMGFFFDAARRWAGESWVGETLRGDTLTILTRAVAIDESRNMLVGIGLLRPDPSGARTAVLDGQGWRVISSSAPNGDNWNRTLIAYSSARSQLVAFGPGTSNAFATAPVCWFFDGTTWLSETMRGPIPRDQHVMAYDSIARRVVVNGGLGNPSGVFLGDTWKFAAGPAAVGLQPVATRAVLDRPASIFLVASGGGMIDYQWRRGGVPLVESDRVKGVDTDALEIVAVALGDAGEYDCVVSNACGTATSVRVRLSVTCPADLDDGSGTGLPDGAVTADDLLYFLGRYSEGASEADLDNGTAIGMPDGGVTIEDLLFFLTRFELGC